MAAQIPVYVINMAKDVGRMASMSAQLKAQGLAFERVEAVAGRDLSPEEKKHSHSPFWFGLLQGRRITDGELGCALSHRKVYQLMLDRSQDCAVIFEDDVELMPEFAVYLENIENETRAFDMVHLFAFRTPEKMHHTATDFQVMTFIGASSSAAAYMLRRSGAKKLMQLPRVYVTADKWVWLAAITGLKRCGIHSYPTRLAVSWSSVSTVRPENSVRLKNNWLWRIFVLPVLRVCRSIVLKLRGV
jgi:glycosyl transferase, family 25